MRQLAFLTCVLLALFSANSFSQVITPTGSGGGGSGTMGQVTITATGGAVNTGTCNSTTLINCNFAIQLLTARTATAGTTTLASDVGEQIILSAATAQTLTLANFANGNFTRVVNEAAGTWTLTAGTGSINGGCTSVAQNQSAVIQFDGVNWNISCGAGSGSSTITAGSTVTAGIASGNFIGSSNNLAVDTGRAIPAGAVVGTSDTQTLINKTYSSGTATGALSVVGQIPEANGGTIANQVPNATGNFFTTLGFGTPSGSPGVITTLYLVPIWIGSPVTIQGAGVRLTTAASAGSISIGLYASGTGAQANRPQGAALVTGTATAVIAPGTQIVSYSSNYSVTAPGWYWVGFFYADVVMRVSSVLNTTGLPMAYWFGTTTSGNLGPNTVMTGLTVVGGVQGTFPTLTSGTLFNETGAVTNPWMFLETNSAP